MTDLRRTSGIWWAALLILVQLFMTSCTQTDTSTDMTDVELENFIDLPVPHQVLGQEMVTLPEPGTSGIPGPTDYVVLIAAVRLDRTERDTFLKDSAEIAPPESVQPQFLRDWLDSSHQEALLNIGKNRVVADLSRFSKRRAKRVVAVPANESDLVIYVEFVSP